jgi:acetylglutamate kinase
VAEEQDLLLKARVLTEVLPYIKKHRGKTVVLKFGGNAMERDQNREMFASDIVLMRYVGINPVIVHGGGPQITSYMERLSKEVSFVEGHRVTDSETMEIAKMVLVGKVNKEIVSLINRHGTLAIGLSGEDGNLIMAKKRFAPDGSDLGWVGEVESVNRTIIDELIGFGLTPVIASVGSDANGNSYNINADTVAGEVAASIKADKIIYLTNVKGITARGGLVSKIDVQEGRAMLERGEISEGMLPKVESCLNALEAGVDRAHIIDGTTEHALLLEVFTDGGVGTMIVGGQHTDRGEA